MCQYCFACIIACKKNLKKFRFNILIYVKIICRKFFCRERPYIFMVAFLCYGFKRKMVLTIDKLFFLWYYQNAYNKKEMAATISVADRLKRAVIRNREYLIKLIQFIQSSLVFAGRATVKQQKKRKRELPLKQTA